MTWWPDRRARRPSTSTSSPPSRRCDERARGRRALTGAWAAQGSAGLRGPRPVSLRSMGLHLEPEGPASADAPVAGCVPPATGSGIVTPRRVIIMGAAGRDFHLHNTVFRDDPAVEVVAFTATQIPGIDERVYPPSLAGRHYPDGIPIRPESTLEDLIARHDVTEVVHAYSDLAHEDVMHT